MSISDVLAKSSGRWHRNDVLGGFARLDDLEQQLGVPLPADYKWFLQFFADGAEGDFESVYLQMLPLDQVRAGYELPEDMRKYVIFAVDGDDAFAFDTARSRAAADYPVVRFSLSSRDADEVETVARNLEDLLRRLSTVGI